MLGAVSATRTWPPCGGAARTETLPSSTVTFRPRGKPWIRPRSRGQCPRHSLKRRRHAPSVTSWSAGWASAAVDEREKDADTWLDAGTRGSELHALYAAMLRRNRRRPFRCKAKKDLALASQSGGRLGSRSSGSRCLPRRRRCSTAKAVTSSQTSRFPARRMRSRAHPHPGRSGGVVWPCRATKTRRASRRRWRRRTRSSSTLVTA